MIGCFFMWRRAWDSNPRGCYTLLAFQASSLATRSTLRANCVLRDMEALFRAVTVSHGIQPFYKDAEVVAVEFGFHWKAPFKLKIQNAGR